LGSFSESNRGGAEVAEANAEMMVEPAGVDIEWIELDDLF
jgi:hypothetical protein